MYVNVMSLYSHKQYVEELRTDCLVNRCSLAEAKHFFLIHNLHEVNK